jgi:hypothetical protein
LRQFLLGHDIRTAAEMGWSALSNGLILDAAEAAGFHVMITADRNMQHQQNMTGRRIAVLIMGCNQSHAATFEKARLSNRHFWREGYDKARRRDVVVTDDERRQGMDQVPVGRGYSKMHGLYNHITALLPLPLACRNHDHVRR